MPTHVAYDTWDVGRLRSPAYDAAEITPSNTVDLPQAPAKSLYIGVSGSLRVTTAAGNTVNFVAVPVGILPLRVLRVLSSGTSAASLVALY